MERDGHNVSSFSLKYGDKIKNTQKATQNLNVMRVKWKYSKTQMKSRLELCTLCKIFSIFFSFFPRNANSCKSVAIGDNFMKCWILYSGKNKKNIISLSSAEFAQRLVKVKWLRLYTERFCCHLQRDTTFADRKLPSKDLKRFRNGGYTKRKALALSFALTKYILP